MWFVERAFVVWQLARLGDRGGRVGLEDSDTARSALRNQLAARVVRGWWEVGQEDGDAVDAARNVNT